MDIYSIAITNIGKVRRNNEDNFYINGRYKKDINLNNDCYYDKSIASESLYGVFDGMGGESDGEIASLIAAKTLTQYANMDFREKLNKYVFEANEAICERSMSKNYEHMGTTMTILFAADDNVTVYNLGDSRAYLCRQKRLMQLTKDHTRAQSLADIGIISQEQVKSHADRNKLTQHLGISSKEFILEPNISDEIIVEDGDVFLLCSDGLTDMISEEKILEILLTNDTIKEKGEKLLDEALINGGRDNITILLVMFIDNGEQMGDCYE